ncbi:MAG: hypothetical protein KDC91_09365 [Flavobacteriaceae bacterium]|nr:hypothetical protein [Flavobacteriaceae bacterium]
MKSNKKYPHGLKTPPSYFDTLEEDIFIKIAEEKLPKDLGFKAPQNYLTSFENKLLSEITSKKEPALISLFPKKHLRYAAPIAAVFLIAFFVFFNQKTNTIDAIQTSEIEAYVTNGNLDLNTQDIAQLLTEDDLESLQIETAFFSEENLENYLLETITDTSLLIE